jgi:hypothetical protein
LPRATSQMTNKLAYPNAVRRNRVPEARSLSEQRQPILTDSPGGVSSQSSIAEASVEPSAARTIAQVYLFSYDLRTSTANISCRAEPSLRCRAPSSNVQPLMA